MIKNIIWLIVGFILAVIILGIYKFNYLASQPGYSSDGNKIEVYSFEECKGAGYEIMESYPEKCSDGKSIFTRGVLKEGDINMMPVESGDGIGSGDHSVFKDLLKKKEEQDKIYKDIPVLEENEFEVEISRSLKECVGVVKKRCFQVKKENSGWELFYDPILGFDYVEGDYYILNIREIKYDFSSPNLPQDISSSTWELMKIIKHIPGEKKENMIIKIPSVNFNEEGRIVTKFKEYKVPKTQGVLKSTLAKLFEVRSNGDKIWNGLKFNSVSIIENTAVINLKGSWYPAGDMSGFYFRNEIDESAKQFDSVKDVRVLVNGKIFNWCVDSNVEPEEDGCDKNPKLWDTALEKDI